MALAVLAPLVLLLAQGAHAQSTYTMTKLMPPFLGVTDDSLFLDAQDRVVGFAGYFRGAGYGLDISGSGKWSWVTSYAGYVSTWSASTMASVWSTKLLPSEWNDIATIADVSRDGSKLLIMRVDNKPVVIDRTSKQPVAYPGGGPKGSAVGERPYVSIVNDQGWSAGSADFESIEDGQLQSTTTAVRWRLADEQVLETDAARFVGSRALAINTIGEVAGEVWSVSNDYVIPHAATWDLNGAVRVLDLKPGHMTRAVAISDNGTVVVVERSMQGRDSPGISFELHASGQVKVLVAPASGGTFGSVTRSGLSPDGSIVVGSWFPFPFGDERFVVRAFIHQQGSTYDLTDFLITKGVKLPAGAYFTRASSVNAQGTILATYVNATGKKEVQVRLKPL